MSKSSIQFACILFMLAAIIASSAQETTTVLNNASMNNTTLLNNTTEIAPASEPAAAPEVAPAENETQVAPTEVALPQNETAPAPAQDAAASENATPTIEEIPAIPVVQPSGISIGTAQKTAFDVSGIGRTPTQFTIDGKALAQGAYEVGLPAKTIMDLSALPFFINKF